MGINLEIGNISIFMQLAGEDLGFFPGGFDILLKKLKVEILEAWDANRRLA